MTNHGSLQPYSKSPRTRQQGLPGLPGQGQHGFGLLLFAFLLRPDLDAELGLGAEDLREPWPEMFKEDSGTPYLWTFPNGDRAATFGFKGRSEVKIVAAVTSWKSLSSKNFGGRG